MKKNKPKTVKSEVAEERENTFLSIYNVKHQKDILELFEAEYDSCKNKSIKKINELYREYSYAIFFLYSPSSIRNNLVKFKNIIKKCGGKYEALALECFTIDAVYSPIKNKDLLVKKEKKELIKNEENAVIDPQTTIKKIEDLKDILAHNKFSIGRNQKLEQIRAYHIVAILGLSIGRRFTELLKTLEIKKRGTKITFSGLLKGNNKEIEGNIIGLSYLEVKDYLGELRTFSNSDNFTEDEINAKYSKVFNNNLKKLGFDNVKKTRYEYSVAGSQLFKEQGETIEDTVTRILGHKEVFSSALSYT